MCTLPRGTSGSENGETTGRRPPNGGGTGTDRSSRTARGTSGGHPSGRPAEVLGRRLLRQGAERELGEDAGRRLRPASSGGPRNRTRGACSEGTASRPRGHP